MTTFWVCEWETAEWTAEPRVSDPPGRSFRPRMYRWRYCSGQIFSILIELAENERM